MQRVLPQEWRASCIRGRCLAKGVMSCEVSEIKVELEFHSSNMI
jgi:hypothetical protein